MGIKIDHKNKTITESGKITNRKLLADPEKLKKKLDKLPEKEMRRKLKHLLAQLGIR